MKKYMKRRISLIFLTLILILLCVNCGQKPRLMFEGISEIDYSEWKIGKPGGSMTISHETDPKSFNVIIANESSTRDVMNRVYSNLVDRDILTLEWMPFLAREWKVSEDGLSAVFTIRENLKWSDGEPLTAEDVVWSVNTVFLNKEVEGSNYDAFYVGEELAMFEKIDDLSFRIITPTLYADIISLANFQPVPKHILEPLIVEKGITAINSYWGVDTDVKSIVGSGPFIIEEYAPNQRIIMSRNPYYWQKDAQGNQLPYLDRLNLVIVEDSNTAFLKFIAGELDTIEEVRGEDVATLIEKKNEVGFEIYNAGPEASTNFITFNQNVNTVPEPKRSWFNNRKFRKAMAHLVDRQTIIDNVYFGFGFPQYSFVPRFSQLYWEDADEEAIKYDPEAAKKLLDELNMKDRDGDGIREDENGNPVSFVIQTNSDNTQRINIGKIISQEMKKAGIDATFTASDFNVIVTALVSTYEWDVIIIGLSGSLQPFLSGSNVYPSRGNLHLIEPNQESPRRSWEKEVDRLYIENTTTTDMVKRKQSGIELQKIWIEEQPWTYTVNEAAIYVFKNNIGNVKPRSVEPYDSWKGIIQYLYIK